ncbi:hypothetical protein SODG_002078 [Sodalis praecaptivus]
MLCLCCANKANTPLPDKIKAQIDTLTRNKHVLVFCGFSGLGYNNEVALIETIRTTLTAAINCHGSENICVAAGATHEGIGIIYELAKEKGIKTIGLVSEQARGSALLSAACDECLFIPDPTASWDVRDPEGNSYMVYLATDNKGINKTGEFLVFGGGYITLNELKEAEGLGLNITVYAEFEPCSQRAAVRLQGNPQLDISPVRTAWKGKNAPSPKRFLAVNCCSVGQSPLTR